MCFICAFAFDLRAVCLTFKVFKMNVIKTKTDTLSIGLGKTKLVVFAFTSDDQGIYIDYPYHLCGREVDKLAAEMLRESRGWALRDTVLAV
jgi:hypothetical protein